MWGVGMHVDTTAEVSSWLEVVRCRTLGGILDERSHCYTLEVSFYSYTTSSGSATVTQPYTEEACILSVPAVISVATLCPSPLAHRRICAKPMRLIDWAHSMGP